MCPDIIPLISAVHVHTMRNLCPLMLLLTLTPSRLFLILPDCSSLCHMTSRSRAYLLSLFCCRLIIITTIYTCPNSNPSPSLSTRSSYNRKFNTALSLCGVLGVTFYFSEGFSEVAAKVSAVAEAPWSASWDRSPTYGLLHHNRGTDCF